MLRFGVNTPNFFNVYAKSYHIYIQNKPTSLQRPLKHWSFKYSH